MGYRGYARVFAPGAAALVAGGAGIMLSQAPEAVILAAAVAAVAAALVFSQTEEFLPRGVDPLDRPAARSADGALPIGLGRMLLAHLPMGVVLVDHRGRVAFMNAAAADLFGRHPEGAFHAAVLRAPKLLDAIEGTLTEGMSSTVHFNLSRPGGLYLHLRGHVRGLASATLFGDGRRGTAALVVIEDETQGRRAEQLHRDFVANASHELKTPLASITAIIETLQGHARDDPDAAARFLALMGSQAERMKRLVEDLLSLNRIEVNERVQPREEQEPWRIVRDVAELLAPLAEQAGMTLAVEAPEQEVTVLGSREELAQLFRNLIENAIKYGRPGGSVRICAATDPAEPMMAGFAVEDDGPGIPREHIPRLTERFYRVSVNRSREKGGTGLGLAIVKHVISRHRGNLEIDSELGRGSRFVVWLPISGPIRQRLRPEKHHSVA